MNLQAFLVAISLGSVGMYYYLIATNNSKKEALFIVGFLDILITLLALS